MELWKDIPGEEGRYQVSSYGRVRSLDRNVRHTDGGVRFHKGTKLRPGIASNGYETVAVSQKTRLVAELVLTAFCGPRPKGKIACHDDGNCRNNYLTNLGWDTPQKNGKDMIRHGRKKLTYAQATSLCRRYSAGEKTRDLASEFGISQRQTYNIINGAQYVPYA